MNNTESTKEIPSVNSTGERLRKARELMCLSQQNVADRLCLKLSTIRDIENNKTPTDLATTFLRGYIRSYARLVRLPEEEVLPTLIEEALVKTTIIKPIKNFSAIKYQKKLDRWLNIFTWLVLFILLSLSVAWWWQNHNQKISKDSLPSISKEHDFSKKEKDSADQNQLIPVDTSTTVNDINASINESLVDSYKNTNISSSVKENSGKEKNLLPTKNKLNTTSNILNMILISFRNDCWIEVTDSTGEKLFRGMQQTGAKLTLTGIAPYRLKIGAPDAVKIEYQGKLVDLSHFIRNKQIAYVTLDK